MSCNCQQSSCGNDYGSYFQTNMNNGGGCMQPQPIVAPKRVCTTFQNQYVEQPIIVQLNAVVSITLSMYHVIIHVMNKLVIHK